MFPHPAQIHDQDARVDVIRGIAAVQAAADAVERKTLLSGFREWGVRNSHQAASFQWNLPQVFDVQIDDDVAVEINDLFHGEGLGGEKPVDGARGKVVVDKPQNIGTKSFHVFGHIVENDVLGVPLGQRQKLFTILPAQALVVQDVHAYGASGVLEDGGHHDARMLGVRSSFCVSGRE